MSSQQYSDQVKLFVKSEVMAKVLQGRIKQDFPRLTVDIGKESPKEHPNLTNSVTIAGFYDSIVEPSTDLLFSLAIEAGAVLYVLFDKDPAGNTHTVYDWTQNT